MATFYANPNDKDDIWIEKAAFEGANFRIWHYIFFCFSAFTVIGESISNFLVYMYYVRTFNNQLQ